MSSELWLKFTLKSEAAFSRGDGVPGVVDIEVNHDRYGLPFLGGRTLKGLLHAEATEIVDGLRRADESSYRRWVVVANALFGQPGSSHDDAGILHIGDACLPVDLRSQVMANYNSLGLHPHDVLETLTTIRQQTAVNPETGSPMEDTLRSVRVILRQTQFEAPLYSKRNPFSADELAFLAACVKAFRRAGSNKTRGYGRLQASIHETLEGTAVTDVHFRRFKEAL